MLGPEEPCEKKNQEEREKTEPLRKAAGNTETCGLTPPPPPYFFSSPPTLSPSLSHFLPLSVQLHSDVSARTRLPPLMPHPCTPDLSATAKEMGERGTGRAGKSVAAGNTYWPFHRAKSMRFISPGPACFGSSTGCVIVRMW